MAAVKRDMTTLEAVKLLPGMSNETLKKWLRDAYLLKAQICPFGHAVITEKGIWQYYIYPERLNAYRTAKDLIVKEFSLAMWGELDG